MIRLIAATDRRRGIAKHAILPWKIPEDEQYFTDKTKAFGGNVLTGGTTFRETYKSHPLKERQNYILSHNTAPIPGATVVNDLDTFMAEHKHEDLWVAGGAAVFKEVIDKGYADELYLTHIDADFGCDQFFPEYEEDFTLVEQSERREQNGFYFTYAHYSKNA